MLKVENIITRYGAIEALKGISLEAQHGEVTCLLGPNGAGKSLLLRLLNGLLVPTSGQIFWSENVGGIQENTLEQLLGRKSQKQKKLQTFTSF